MKRSSLLGLFASLALASGAFAQAFSFTANGGTLADNNINLFPILLDDPGSPGKSVPFIQSLELELTGLSHTFPDDLDIYLIDPLLNSIKVMTDKGGTFDLVNANLIFNNAAAGLPPDNAQINNGTYRPEGLAAGIDQGFNEFVGLSGGTSNWLLLIIDDSAADTGSLTSFTLRGTVPEPATLSLLALGAIAAIRRRRAA